MAITAKAVKELRDRTGAGMMDCKKALQEVGGDLDEAIKFLRTKGLAAAAKKAHRKATEGLVSLAGDESRMAMVELNCETDFVARNEDFQKLATGLADQALAEGVDDVESFKGKPYTGSGEGHTVEQAISQTIATIGENIVLSRAVRFEAAEGNRISSYLHMGGKIGVLVEGSGSLSEDALHDVAMHVAASEPRFTRREEVTETILANEREIALKQAIESGKPENIAERIVSGKMEKFFEQEVLLEQPFAKDTSMTVAEYLRQAGGDAATVARFERFKLGEVADA
jgi:elongation factor Ts